MGGFISSDRNNDDLIDSMLEGDYIKSSIIERVFRAVDRAEYFLAEARTNAYKDLAWKHSNLHISAPSIYSEVMEGLCLEPGLSFLNLGSGTGYLSTMVGLVLGSSGINHGIEYYSDVVQYANKKVEDFRKYSGAIDEFDYCEPKFMQGNCLCLSSDFHAQYDRVYCGAACPEEFESYMINLLKVGGILVMPLHDQLLQFKRTSETNWSVKHLMPVAFAPLIEPLTANTPDLVRMFDVETSSLQSLCRSVIRNILRKNVELEHPPVKRKIPVQKGPKRKRVLRRLVVPLFETDSSDDDRLVRLGGSRNVDAGRAVLNLFMGIIADGPPQQNSDNITSDDRETEQSTSEENRMDTDSTEEESEKISNQQETRVETKAVIEHNPSTSNQNVGSSNDRSDVEFKAESNFEDTVNPVENVDNEQSENPEENSEMQGDANCLDSITEIHDVFVDVLNVLRRERGEGEPSESHDDQDDTEDDRVEVTENNQSSEEVLENQPGSSDLKNKTEGQKKRQKFDSGLGDEIVETHSVSSDDETDMKLEGLELNSTVDVASSSDDDHREKSNKRVQTSSHESRRALKWRRIESDIQRFVAHSSSENENDEPKVGNEMLMYESPYTEHMRAKIQQLPLPTILKRYMNFYREF